jgi:16S rRNA (guanine527-N7)-methyltransferase
LVSIIQPLNASREAILADLGSGAGFPGMVLALSGIPNIHLIESDQRKCAFLRELSRVCFNASREALQPTIHNNRIEKINLTADIITSRAFADLNKTLEISKNLRHPDTIYILLKSLDLEKELTEALKNWYFNHEITPSVTDPRGCILKISQVKQK